jgi:hypothetical protein
MYAGHRMVDASASRAEFAYGLVGLSQQEARESVTVLANMAYYIVEKLRLISLDAPNLQEGKLIMCRTH